MAQRLSDSQLIEQCFDIGISIAIIGFEIEILPLFLFQIAKYHCSYFIKSALPPVLTTPIFRDLE
jgi:hypothetical protein